MNKLRRFALAGAALLLDEAKGIIEDAAIEEREYYDNMPESLQSSERGETADEMADALQGAADVLDDMLSTIRGAAQS